VTFSQVTLLPDIITSYTHGADEMQLDKQGEKRYSQ